MSVGHDEYWSGDQRANVEAARDAGREPRVLQRQPDLLEDPLGAEHRRHGIAVPDARVLQGDARRREDRPDPGVDGHVARPAVGAAFRRGPTRERADRHHLHGQLLHRRRSRCRPSDEHAAPVAQHADLRRSRARTRRSPTERSATSGTTISTTGRARRARSTCRRRRASEPEILQDEGSTYATGTRDALGHDAPRAERRAGLRRGHGAVVVGTRRNARPGRARRRTRRSSRPR